jgi:hypothetical protein
MKNPNDIKDIVKKGYGQIAKLRLKVVVAAVVATPT